MYYFTTTLKGVAFDDVIAKVNQALQEIGFGVLTDIDIQATMRKKLGVDMYKYRILGACNPGYAYKALTHEDKIGTMLPCNVIVQERKEGEVEVSAVDPMASMASVKNPELGDVAREVGSKLKEMISSL